MGQLSPAEFSAIGGGANPPQVANTIESLLHSKAECGIWVSYKKSPITSAKFCRRTPVIRIGHGSTVPYGEYPVIGLHYLEVVGCSKLSIIQQGL